MEYIRRETPYDGQANDWMAFAAQQAEFYKNVNQYVINLQLRMDDIDEEIAVLLEEIENSTCNVAQGYKFFKRLKELRLERKQMSKELECLYILTDRVDVEEMATTCECNAELLEQFLCECAGTKEMSGTVGTEAEEGFGESEPVISVVGM